MLFDISLHLVLDEVGGDGVQHRTHHEVVHARVTSRVTIAAHLALGWREGGTDVVDLFYTLHRTGEHCWFGQVADDNIRNSGCAKGNRGRLRSNTGAHLVP